MSSVYKQIQTVRVELQNMSLKKTGFVSFPTKSGNKTEYGYYELSDILPAINTQCEKSRIATSFSIVPGEYEYAELKVYSFDGDSYAVFKSSTAEANSLGDPLKNLGAKITYMRRYLLMMAFEIVESDFVEKSSRENSTELSKADQELIRSAKNVESLKKTCAKLKLKYKVELIQPLYEEKKIDLQQEPKGAK
ncbi:hypothetical protein LCGC14_0963680 [marine sediment metagenome]|uniref:Uncharacterized protein n=1 Tax=marine sediment metagenome TaxID=412755 RepID=A0A0F9NDT1_9ZZZZ